MATHLVDAGQLDKDSIQRAFRLNERTQKVITFVFPLIQNGVLGPLCKFPFAGCITNIDAYCAHTGVEDTIIDIEKIAGQEFADGFDTWDTIFAAKRLTISANEKQHDGAYTLATSAVDRNDIFRVNFIHTGPVATPIDNLRARDLTVQITISI